MALFAISDLHLSFGTNKPMEVFGWDNYETRLEENWRSVVKDTDTVIIPGDISWAMYLEETVADFAFIDKLPGRKIILKGNHDYWWTTLTKMNKFVTEQGFDTINFLFNNSYSYNDLKICGTRGWGNNGTADEDTGIWNRELQRLLLSVGGGSEGDIICCLHYPPTDLRGGISEEYIEIFKKFNINRVYYGHLHGNHSGKLPDEVDGIKFSLVSCDYLGFMPLKISD